MNLTAKPEIIIWPETHYVYIEKLGPFMQTAQPAWQELNQVLSEIARHNRVTAMMSQFKIEPDKLTYRAGAAVAAKPNHKLPDGVNYILFKGGRYSKFTYVGSYSNMPAACGRVFEIAGQTKLPQRDDFCIENYVNDPKITPEEKLITEILLPTA